MSVAIVGAGPGDPGLVTVRALELVRAAQVLVYDRLVSAELVAEASRAIRIPHEGLTQARVNELLVRNGRRGRRVVRLKGGDPFLFGRGAEEVEALEAAGVPYEVVPGVSTLTALPGLAGIPLTTRGVADQLTVVTGTRADGAGLDFRRLAATPGTIVIFMGLERLAEIATGLVGAGRAASEPAAVASRISLPDYDLRVGTLGTIAALAADVQTPALVVIGKVVELAFRSHDVWSAIGD
jgi:uroporphyrin-III C-methyltransferase/precorrin-2 dehydrogenase/sirohydrochlorin ferrochelatase